MTLDVQLTTSSRQSLEDLDQRIGELSARLEEIEKLESKFFRPQATQKADPVRFTLGRNSANKINRLHQRKKGRIRRWAAGYPKLLCVLWYVQGRRTMQQVEIKADRALQYPGEQKERQ